MSKDGVSMKRKIFCFMLSFILFLFLPVTGYLSAYNSCAYAFEATIDSAAIKYILPVAAYMGVKYENALTGIDIVEAGQVAKKIAEVGVDVIKLIPADKKVVIARFLTDLTTQQINQALNTSYSEAEIDALTAYTMSRWDSSDFGSRYRDIYELGISHVFANSVKKVSNYGMDRYVDFSTTFSYGYYLYIRPVFERYYLVSRESFDKSFWSLFGFVYISSVLGNVEGRNYYNIVNNSTYTFGSYRYRIDAQSCMVFAYGSGEEITPLGILSNSKYFSGDGTGEVSLIHLESFINGDWVILKTYSNVGREEFLIDMVTALDDLLNFTGIDLTQSSYYRSDVKISDVFNFTYDGTISIGSPGTMAVPLGIPAIGSEFFGEDVSQGDVERLIGSLGTSATYDVNVQTKVNENDDPDTNIDLPFVTDVTVSATTETDVPDVNTAPDDGPGTVDPPITDIPILGDIWQLLKSILDWLKGLLEALKNLFLSLLIPSAGFFTNYFTNLKNFVGERLGLLDYPLELLILFANSYMNIPDSGSIVIDVPALQVNILGTMYTFFPAYTFDFNSVFGMSAFGQLRNAYLVAVDVIVALGLVYLLSKKGAEVFRK